MRISDWSSDVCSSDLALYLSPGFAPIPGLSEPALTDRQFDEVRAQMITPRALGGDSGRHMAATDMVSPLKETPERPQIDLSVAVGNGASRSEERRVGKEGVSTCRSRWSPDI